MKNRPESVICLKYQELVDVWRHCSRVDNTAYTTLSKPRHFSLEFLTFPRPDCQKNVNNCLKSKHSVTLFASHTGPASV